MSGKVYKGQIVEWGDNANEIGRISSIRRDGFYARYRSSWPTTPGGWRHAMKSLFFSYADLDAGKVRLIDRRRLSL